MSERVVAAAAELTCEVGWSGVTMGKLADRVGVSRQTVYNEMGSKPALAEAMVLRELATFLAAVDRAFDRHPQDLVDAIRAAVTDVLVEAERNALLQAVVSSAYGAESDLLPLLTTESDALVHTAHQVVAGRVATYDVEVDARPPRRGDRHGRADGALARHPSLRPSRGDRRGHRVAGGPGPAHRSGLRQPQPADGTSTVSAWSARNRQSATRSANVCACSSLGCSMRS